MVIQVCLTAAHGIAAHVTAAHVTAAHGIAAHGIAAYGIAATGTRAITPMASFAIKRTKTLGFLINLAG